MAVIRLVDGADDAVEFDQRIDFLELLRRQDPELVADEVADALDVAELVHPLLGAGDAQRAAGMEAGRQSRFGRQPFAVQADRMRPHFHDRGVVGEMRAETGGMPGGTGGQLGFLDQHDVAPAALGKMVEQRNAHGAAADDHDPCMCSHVQLLSRVPAAS